MEEPELLMEILDIREQLEEASGEDEAKMIQNENEGTLMLLPCAVILMIPWELTLCLFFFPSQNKENCRRIIPRIQIE